MQTYNNQRRHEQLNRQMTYGQSLNEESMYLQVSNPMYDQIPIQMYDPIPSQTVYEDAFSEWK